MVADAEPLQLTLQAAAQIRGLIIDRVLLPGEKIRQVELAERIGVSRGYVVAKLDDDDLGQIHRMRTLLEDELLRTVERPDAAVLSDLKDLNEKMMVAIDEHNVPEVLRYNREFHFTIFDLSSLNQFRREVRRLWQMSEGYSAAWWWRQPEARKRINAEHKAIISALRRYDLDRLVEICDAHRVGGWEGTLSGLTHTTRR
jgi:DNA-binding GntR family transcriptional regulator